MFDLLATAKEMLPTTVFGFSTRGKHRTRSPNDGSHRVSLLPHPSSSTIGFIRTNSFPPPEGMLRCRLTVKSTRCLFSSSAQK